MHTYRWARLVVITVLVLAFYFLAPIESEPEGGIVLRAVLAVLVFTGLAASLVIQIRLSLADESRRLDGLVTAIVCVWVVFALSFYGLADHQPGQVSGLDTKVDSLYFTASTMLTVGYGDVHATGQFARVLVLLQMLFDVVFVAAAAGTVSAHLRRQASQAQERKTQRNPR
ncbi:MAG TPA: potassium channel family protein [Nocardioides sp.]|uniref:potassium channel family protein n=1 Tax=Nocardioides sp. TaxID=35761 RepID=UPI002E36C409|nr:potassium channel family protein [Nocardioides sp.]HEX5087926.1 potassium channel family protein [Nocardioides sp.]